MVVERGSNGEFGGTIVRMKINGQEFDPSTEYTVVSTEFIRKGGDGYKSLALGKVLNHPHNGELLYSVVLNHLQSKGVVAPVVEQRITVV